MDTDLLRAFVAVADTGGFSSAANLLNRTQSAVSLQVKRLEERLDTSLFDRTSRSVTLSTGGARMLPYARQLLLLEEQAQAAVAHNRASETLRLGLTEEHAAAYLPQILETMVAEYPDVRLDISCDISSRLVESFQRGELDLVLVVRHRPTRTGRLLGVEQLIWVCRDDFEPDFEKPIPLALNPDGCIFRAHALAALGREGRDWHEPYVSTSPTGINIPVRTGLAVTVKTPRSVPSGCSEAGKRLGLPELGLAEIEMHVSPARISEASSLLVSEITRLTSKKWGSDQHI
ncbi:LysR family transcriptional regulator [Roseibium sediminicola]|uniref:LysR family transcriptional regulator n=1 Tax=Roseibium sediminicola TaxID=2933272 RepID=A0ABT0H3E3_9HYPH|nr:LysR family transcriptional regulator [Roseibium sp. CAU 1639]MCK7616194.1 LysR family transcriptional regulator [Roseibium sp. CAU 1639]